MILEEIVRNRERTPHPAPGLRACRVMPLALLASQNDGAGESHYRRLDPLQPQGPYVTEYDY